MCQFLRLYGYISQTLLPSASDHLVFSSPSLGFPPLRLLKDRRIKPKGQIHPLQSTKKQLKLQLFVKRSVQRFRDLTIQHNKKRTRYLTGSSY